MTSARVVILGAGFAGLSAARAFKKHGNLFDVMVIDRNENTHFRPLIPDVVSRTVHSRHLVYPISAYADRFAFTFVHAHVSGIDFDAHRIASDGNDIGFDYCIIAVGSQTPLPPTEQLRRHAVRVDTAYDAARIRHMVAHDGYERILVCGGGYTGVELAFHLQKLIDGGARKQHVIIVEMMDRIIGTLPEWMQAYTHENCTRTGIDMKLSTTVEEVKGREARLSTGETVDNALCIWTTGLAAPTATAGWNTPKGRAGRIAVDSTLRFRERCYAAGDIACVGDGKRCSRLAVQIALDQGALAARNILAETRGKRPASFKVRDPGFIVPMANGLSCGEVFGIRVKGFPATIVHYLASIYRSSGFINRAGILGGLMRIGISGLKGGRCG